MVLGSLVGKWTGNARTTNEMGCDKKERQERDRETEGHNNTYRRGRKMSYFKRSLFGESAYQDIR